jgi:hypothetical protein
LEDNSSQNNNLNINESTGSESPLPEPPPDIYEPLVRENDSLPSQKLIHKSANCKIFQYRKTGLLSFKWSPNAPPEQINLISQANFLQSRVKVEIMKSYQRECYNVIKNALLASLMIYQAGEYEEHFDYAADYIDHKKEEQKKLHILHSNQYYEIFLGNNQKTINVWMHNQLRERKRAEIDEFRRLKTIINIFLTGKQKELALRQLGTALSSAFHNTDNNSAMEKFKSIETFTYSRATLSAKIHHFAATLILILIVVGISMYYYHSVNDAEIKHFIIGSIAGVIGSFISITQRSDKIVVDFSAPVSIFLIQSFSKLILGLFFGIITILLIKSNIIALLSEVNSYSMAILCVVAGFSERFVPDLLEKISNKSGLDETKP